MGDTLIKRLPGKKDRYDKFIALDGESGAVAEHGFHAVLLDEILVGNNLPVLSVC